MEVHVVRTVAVGHGRGQDGFFGDTGDGAVADFVAEDDVDVDGQVGAVVFVGSYGKDGNAVLFGGIFGFVPDHFGEAVFHGMYFLYFLLV